jgi:polyisoprenoid-binding protein YceI
VTLLKPAIAAAAAAALFTAFPARVATSPQARAGLAAPADPTAWKIDSVHSAANFAVRHLLVSTVRGKMGPVSGTIWYDGKNVSSIRADTVIDVKRLSSGDDARDKDLRGPDFFAADQYPTMAFKSKRSVPVDAGHFQLIGDLRIRETTKEVTLDVEGPLVAPVSNGQQRLAATITTTINRFDYGLKWNALVETGGAVVGPDVKITVDLEVTRPSTPTRLRNNTLIMRD